MKHRILSVFLALSLCAGILPAVSLTVSAAAFSDISDADTAEAAEVLSGLGIVSGISDGIYAPDSLLTRAQFCVLAVKASPYRDQVQSSAYRTLFSDLPAAHWAAAYVNLAQDHNLINGYGNGTFGPSDSVTVGQAVTVALRLLGYTTEEIGAFWPEDYMQKASDLGLTSGIRSSAYAAMTRGEAALLFYRLLQSDTSDGRCYAETLTAGSISGAVLLDNDADSAGALQIYASGSISTYGQATAISDDMLGRRGTLLLNQDGTTAGFVPDTDAWRTVTPSDVTAADITDADGAVYSIPAGAVLLLDGEATTYGNGWYNLEHCRRVTLLYSAGGVVDTVAAFESAAYEGVALTGYYEDARPSAANPGVITLLGLELEVADSAAAALSQFEVGDRITVTLNSAGEVEDASSASASSGSMVGLVESLSSASASVRLFSGLTVSGSLSSEASGIQVGSVVQVHSSGIGKITLRAVSSKAAAGSLNVAAKKLGSVPLADRLTIYDRIRNSIAVEIDLEDIQTPSVAASDIVYAGTNSSGEVNVLVLNNVTGNAYTYGILHRGVQTADAAGSYVNRTVSVENADGTTDPCISNHVFTNGDVGGIAVTSEGTVASLILLEEAEAVARSSFQGTESVVLDGVQVPVSSNVQVCNSDTGNWVTLEEAKAYAGSFTVYYSGEIGTDAVVRVIITD